jgi:hypothetical protein
MLQTPVLFLVFNRPEEGALVFEQIRLQQPARLFVAADGPRPHRAGEVALCNAAREYVLNHIDWPCEVKTLFRSSNLGCGRAVSTAIDWFFEQVEEGIILEDDCIPDPTFFSFCAELLVQYRDSDRVMHIGGSNFQLGIPRSDASYYFSRHIHVWGWATWRRAWKKYDFSLGPYQHLMKEKQRQRIPEYLVTIHNRRLDTWDVQWAIAIWFSNGCGITPNVNLTHNIGFGKEATHTRHLPGWFRKMSYGGIFPVIHPAAAEIDEAADRFTSEELFNTGTLRFRISGVLHQVPALNKLYKRFFL